MQLFFRLDVVLLGGGRCPRAHVMCHHSICEAVRLNTKRRWCHMSDYYL